MIWWAKVGDFAAIAVDLGVKTDGETVTIPFFNTLYSVTRDGVKTPDGSPASFGVGVVLCNYLIQCPDDTPRDDEWYSYKDFKNAAPLVGTFANTVERPIAENFSGRLKSSLFEYDKGLLAEQRRFAY